MVRHQVEDYPRWRTAFDDHEDFRKESGEKSARVFQSSDDPNDVLLVFGWESEESGRRFLDSDNLKEAMQKAGVIGKPEVHFLNGNE
jgi:heme-degrading monooxygenase HmoA